MIGLTLAGGAAWGLSHLGVLEVLEENNIDIDIITGTSAGGLAGCLWASGMSSKEMQEIVANINWITFGKPIFPRRGLLDSQKLEEFIDEHIGENKTFADLNIPLEVVATDLLSGEMIVLNKGNLSTAIRASACIPMVFTPVEYQNKLLVDGGLVNNLPVDIALERGADKVIAVDFSSAKMTNDELNTQWEIGYRTLIIMQEQSVRINRDKAKVLIKPHVEDISPASLSKSDILIQRGREAAEKALPELQAL